MFEIYYKNTMDVVNTMDATEYLVLSALEYPL